MVGVGSAGFKVNLVVLEMGTLSSVASWLGMVISSSDVLEMETDALVVEKVNGGVFHRGGLASDPNGVPCTGLGYANGGPC